MVRIISFFLKRNLNSETAKLKKNKKKKPGSLDFPDYIEKSG